MNHEKKYCIPRKQTLLGQTTKQPLSNFDLQKPWKYKQLWELKPDPKLLIKKVYTNDILLQTGSYLYTDNSCVSYKYKEFEKNQIALNK